MLKNIYKVPNGKLLKIFLEKEGTEIKRITITGDFFAYPENCIEKLEHELVGSELDEEKLENLIRNVIQANDFEIFGFDETSLTAAIIGCK